MIVRIRTPKVNGYKNEIVPVICDDSGKEIFELKSAVIDFNINKNDTLDISLPGVDYRQLITMS